LALNLLAQGRGTEAPVEAAREPKIERLLPRASAVASSFTTIAMSAMSNSSEAAMPGVDRRAAVSHQGAGRRADPLQPLGRQAPDTQRDQLETFGYLIDRSHAAALA